MNVQTRAQLELALADQKPSWENTVESIFTAHADNLLLEFTATHDYENPNRILTENSKYRIIGVPSFCHQRYENQFKDDLNAALKPTTQTSE